MREYYTNGTGKKSSMCQKKLNNPKSSIKTCFICLSYVHVNNISMHCSSTAKTVDASIMKVGVVVMFWLHLLLWVCTHISIGYIATMWCAHETDYETYIEVNNEICILEAQSSESNLRTDSKGSSLN